MAGNVLMNGGQFGKVLAKVGMLGDQSRCDVEDGQVSPGQGTADSETIRAVCSHEFFHIASSFGSLLMQELLECLSLLLFKEKLKENKI